jgi:surface antigen
MKTTSKFIAIALAATMLAGCQQGPNGRPGTGVMNGGGVNKQDVGTVAGAVGGGVLGSMIGKGHGAVAATIGGALLGGFLGNSIGGSLDNADRAAADAAAARAFENNQPGQSLPWQGNNASGVITPSNYYQQPDGRYCREYSQKITVGGKTQQGYGKACRQPDGTWQIVEQ